MARLFWLVLIAATACTAAAQPLPVEEFFKRPDYAHLALSPDGRRIAGLVRGSPRDALAVIDVETKKGGRIAHFGDADVLHFRWISNDRLFFSAGDAHEAAADADFYGYWAVNADGSQLVQIAPARAGLSYVGSDGDGNILVAGRGRDQFEAFVLDTKTGKRRLLTPETPAPNVVHWLADRRGIVRVAISRNQEIDRLWYRESFSAPWTKLEEAPTGRLSVRPLAFDFDDRTLYVSAYAGQDKAAIYQYDFAKRTVGERIARHLDVDMSQLIFSAARRRLLGIAYDADKPGVIWLYEHYARLQQMVDRALPDTVNRLSIADRNPKWALVEAHSDKSPVTYYLLDTEKPALQKFASSRPWIKPEAMSERKFVRYKARDGLEIPAYLTIPKGSSGKNLPLVVEIHGGPWVPKQTWGFNEHAQFFASRGYAVLQPDFRGTLGYGQRHYQASFGQWGFAMQDDITDGVEWLIGEGIADKSRICLVGASYGGYATLWGLMKTPDLYRCGVAYVALTDIGLYFSFDRWDMGRVLFTESERARTLIGDPDRDSDKFRSVSPLYQVERLKAPVLLAYGGVDARVPLKHGTRLRSALDRHGKKYEWVVYNDEAHGFRHEKNRLDFYRRVDAFLKQHLGKEVEQDRNPAPFVEKGS